jgi:hypothetical protein
MKRNIFAVFMVIISCLFFGCAGGPKSINFNDLDTKTFTLTYINYMTNMEEYNQEIPKLFQSLPIQNVVKQIESRYGISIDTGLFENQENNISNIKSYNIGMPNYFIDYESASTKMVSINFGKFQQEAELKVVISLYTYVDEKLTGRNETTIFIPGWSPF